MYELLRVVRIKQKPTKSGKKYASGGNRTTKPDYTKMKHYAISEKCTICGTYLGLKGGYRGTGICGPCCTGEAATVDEYLETW